MSSSKIKEKLDKTPLDKMIAEINKEFGETIISRVEDFQEQEVERYQTGIPQLDNAVGGGFPKGKMIELFGFPSSGKSTVSLLLCADAQRKGQEVVYIDCEATFDPVFARSLGVNPDRVILVQTSVGEELFTIIRKILEAKPGIIVIDSIGAMITKNEEEADFEKAFVAPKARLMSRALPIINEINTDTLMIFINQLRTNVTPMGAFGNTTPGGKAMGYYASVRVEFKVGKDFLYPDGKKSGQVIGQSVEFNIKKNKTAKPHETGSFKFFYDGPRFE